MLAGPFEPCCPPSWPLGRCFLTEDREPPQSMHQAFSDQSPQTRPGSGREWGWSVIHGQIGALEGRVFPKAACRAERSSAPTAARGPRQKVSLSRAGRRGGRPWACVRQGDGPAAGGDDGLLLAVSQSLRPERLWKEPAQWSVEPAGAARLIELALAAAGGGQWQTIVQKLGYSALILVLRTRSPLLATGGLFSGI